MPTPTRQLTPVNLPDVAITRGFWKQWQDTNRKTTVPYEYDQCKKTGRIDAIKLKWKPGDGDPPHIFWDSDVAKWLEAACYSLTTHPDAKLKRRVDRVVDLFVKSQQPDGYINSHYSVADKDKRWSNLRDRHELYCAGHLMEAAVAHHEATGSRKLLDAMCRYADYIDATFGREPGKLRGYPGHEEIELALVKLYRATGEERYLKLSKYFVDERGRRPHYYDQEAKARGEDPGRFHYGKYDQNQSHKPVREQDEAVGHSVRAMYLYAGMADVAAETGDEALFAACKRLWENTTQRKMYVTGGVGASHSGEKFTADYDLPNASAYAETCAAIGLVFFAHRMLQITGDAQYADVMERALYNGVASGLGRSGKEFFYVNPLESDGTHHRQPWFGCACCPPNIARLLASLGRYMYSASKAALYVHLYNASQATLQVAGRTVTLTQETDYPWDWAVDLTVGVAEPTRFALMLRIPEWSFDHRIRVNGKAVKAKVVKGYAKIEREWSDGDQVQLLLPMYVQFVAAHPGVLEDTGKVAIQRGPIVYCLEQCDHPVDVRAICVPKGEPIFNERLDKKLLAGCVAVEMTGMVMSTAGWSKRLYRPAYLTKTKNVKIRAIPYCLWDNRQPGSMVVWLPRAL